MKPFQNVLKATEPKKSFRDRNSYEIGALADDTYMHVYVDL